MSDLKRDPARLVCPSCDSPEALWASATFMGWHSIDANLIDGRRKLKLVTRGWPYAEVEARDPVDLDGIEMGCSCGWEGDASQLVQLALNGERLPELHPAQMALLEPTTSEEGDHA